MENKFLALNGKLNYVICQDIKNLATYDGQDSNRGYQCWHLGIRFPQGGGGLYSLF